MRRFFVLFAVLPLCLFAFACPATARDFNPLRDLFPGRDRGQDPDLVDPNPFPNSPQQVIDARSQADTAYQQGNYAKVVELTDWLITNYPQDHAYVAYHLRASAKIELGKATRS